MDSGYSSLNVSASSQMGEEEEEVMALNGLLVPAPGPERAAAVKLQVEASRPAPYPTPAAPKASGGGGRRGRNPDRKERKKEQNRSAALRYQKKKDEKGGVQDECDQLEQRNKELKDKVESISREINYLKDLMAEVYKAKGKKLTGKFKRK